MARRSLGPSNDDSEAVTIEILAASWIDFEPFMTLECSCMGCEARYLANIIWAHDHIVDEPKSLLASMATLWAYPNS